MDELIQQLIVREISADIGKVAQKLIVRQLAKVNTQMKKNWNNLEDLVYFVNLLNFYKIENNSNILFLANLRNNF